MMNIIILPTTYPTMHDSHAAIFVKDQVNALQKNYNVNISVIGALPVSFKDIFRKKVFKFGYFESFENGVNINLFIFPSIPKLKRFNNYIRYILNKRLLKKITKKYGKADIIHVHNFVAGEAALWYKKEFNVPYCVTEHSSIFSHNLFRKYEINLYNKVYSYSSYNIAVSKKFSSFLSEKLSIKFHYLPNVVDTDFFVPCKKNENILNGFNFINIGYLNRNKNHLLLIKAFVSVFKGDKNIKLSILGDGIEFTRLKKEIEINNMQDQINLYGFAPRDEVLRELQKSDALVLSSKYETFGVVIIEAMSCGLPIVATKCGGPETIVTNDNLGLLVEQEINDLGLGMQKIIKNNYNKKYIRNSVVNNFSEQVISEKLIKIYYKVINIKK